MPRPRLKVTIDDLWLKHAPDGSEPTPAQKRSLANAKDPARANIPDCYRTRTYGRGKRWRCRWFDSNNKAYSKAFNFRREAEEYATALEDDLRSGRYNNATPAPNRTLADVAAEWLESRADLAPSTRHNHTTHIQGRILPALGATTPIRTITTTHIQTWINTMAQDGYSPGYIKTNIETLRMIMKYSVKRGYTSSNPCNGITRPKTPRQDPVILTPEELHRLIAAARETSPRDTLIITLMALTGLRVGEALALQVGDLDLDHGTARITRTITTDTAGHQTTGPTKTASSQRTIAIPPTITPTLRQQTAGRAPTDSLWGPMPSMDHWITNRFHTYVNAAGINTEHRRITPHTLRHTYASIAIANGADIKTLQKQLGHTTATTTLDTYAALWPNRLQDVANAVGTALNL